LLVIQMTGEKLFYKYQSLKVAVDNDGKVIKDDNGNDIIYTMENLANNQLYFKDPTKFNDPFDSKVFLEKKGTEENWISWFDRVKGYDRTKAKEILHNNEAFYKEGDFFILDPNGKYHQQIGSNLHGDINENVLPRVCCFSGTDESILMWSHYANEHKGICLRFRSFIDPANTDYVKYFLPLGISTQSVANIPFLKVDYIDPNPVNIFDPDRNKKVVKFLCTKCPVWKYELEYRMLPFEDELEDGFIKYNKKDLEGVIFGLKISHKDAKLVYETVKKNYLDVNFYESKEVSHKYEVTIEPIDDVEKYLNDLHKKEQLTAS